MKVLVLGQKGMLGHMVKIYLERKNVDISVIDYRFPSHEFYDHIRNYTGDYIINCIGAIPQKTKNFEVNVDLPIWLDKNANCKIIHAGTDCEMDSDDYGISKRVASTYIKNFGLKTKIIKTSIIGPEINNSKYSLLEWFLSSQNEIYGYTKAFWNGNTTLEWAKNCFAILCNWEDYQKETILEGECISKFELLKKIKDVFCKDINILESEKVDCNKCLRDGIKTPDIATQLIQLKEEYYD